jgi:histidinol dehydrogenase
MKPIALRRLSTRDKSFERKLDALTRYDAAQDPKVQGVVRRILADVRKRGDAAVREYTKRFDGVLPKDFALGDQGIPREQADALRAAHERIKAFHEKQLQQSWQFTEADGTRLGQAGGRRSPRVGLYVPGGKRRIRLRS